MRLAPRTGLTSHTPCFSRQSLLSRAGSSSEYVQGVLTYQRKWSRLLAQSAGQCDQIEEQVRAARSEVARLGLHGAAVK